MRSIPHISLKVCIHALFYFQSCTEVKAWIISFNHCFIWVMFTHASIIDGLVGNNGAICVYLLTFSYDLANFSVHKDPRLYRWDRYPLIDQRIKYGNCVTEYIESVIWDRVGQKWHYKNAGEIYICIFRYHLAYSVKTWNYGKASAVLWIFINKVYHRLPQTTLTNIAQNYGTLLNMAAPILCHLFNVASWRNMTSIYFRQHCSI